MTGTIEDCHSVCPALSEGRGNQIQEYAVSHEQNDSRVDRRAATERSRRWNRATALLMPKLGAFAQTLSADEQWVLAYLLRDAVIEGDDAPEEAEHGPIWYWPQPNSLIQQPERCDSPRAAPRAAQSPGEPGQWETYGADEWESADQEEDPGGAVVEAG